MDRLESSERRLFAAVAQVEAQLKRAAATGHGVRRAQTMVAELETKADAALKQIREVVRQKED